MDDENLNFYVQMLMQRDNNDDLNETITVNDVNSNQSMSGVCDEEEVATTPAIPNDGSSSNGWEENDEDEFEYDDEELEMEMVLDEMYDFEEEFDLQEKENGKYYLGMYMNIQDVRIMSSGFLVGEKPLMFFGNAISTELFFKYKYSHVIKYMKSIIMCRNINPVIDIMQLKISEDGLYLAIIKTYWRNWLFLINFR